MKLTTAIKAATQGLDRLERQRGEMESDVRERGKKLTAMRAEYDAHRDMLNAMLKLQDAMPEGETIEFRYHEPEAERLTLVRKLCECYLSERREIGQALGLDVQGAQPDIEYVRAIMEAAKAQDRLDEVQKRADTFIANHKNLGERKT